MVFCRRATGLILWVGELLEYETPLMFMFQFAAELTGYPERLAVQVGSYLAVSLLLQSALLSVFSSLCPLLILVQVALYSACGLFGISDSLGSLYLLHPDSAWHTGACC